MMYNLFCDRQGYAFQRQVKTIILQSYNLENIYIHCWHYGGEWRREELAVRGRTLECGVAATMLCG